MINIISTLFFLVLPILHPGANGQSHDGNANCECYQVQSGNDSVYLSNYRFYDFRYFAANGTGDFSQAPASVSQAGQTSTVQAALTTDSFTTDWAIQDWGNTATIDSPVAKYNSYSNVFVMATNNTDLGVSDTSATTFLNLRTLRFPTFQSTAEMENTQRNLMYASIRFHARISGDSGACAGMFIVRDNNNEADIEILTRDPTGTYRYSNQPDTVGGNSVPGASIEVDNMPNWTDWHTHRLDWLPGIVRSYLDDELVDEKTVNVPKKPTFIDVNMWSDGGVWSGVMPSGGQANLQVQWIEATFNTSGAANQKKRSEKRTFDHKHFIHKRLNHLSGIPLAKRKTTGCSKICSIDSTNQTGVPVLIADVSQVAATNMSWKGTSMPKLAAILFIILFLSMLIL